MKILFVSQYYPPEGCAPAARVSELCRHWTQAGIEVTVLTAFPNHPKGIIPPEYRGKCFQVEETEGCRVLRSWIYPAPNRAFFRRLIGFLSFFLSSIFFGALRAGRPDLTIATSPQIFAGLSGWVISVIKRTPFIMEVRDLWPESAIELGVIRNPALIVCSRFLERFLYRRADLLIAVSNSIQTAILNLGIPKERVRMIPNGADLKLFKPAPAHNTQRAELGLDGKFVVSYIGTHGMAHDLNLIVDAAERLKERQDLHFLFVGEGAQKEELIRYSQSKKICNITFLPSQPRNKISEWYSLSDVCLIVLRDLPVFETVLPSKMFEIMACERPQLLAARGECANLLASSEAGIVIPPGSVDDLVESIVKLADTPGLCEKLGIQGRKFVTEFFDRSRLAETYLEIIREMKG